MDDQSKRFGRIPEEENDEVKPGSELQSHWAGYCLGRVLNRLILDMPSHLASGLTLRLTGGAVLCAVHVEALVRTVVVHAQRQPLMSEHPHQISQK